MPADISAHTHHAHADSGGWSNLPRRLDSDWMSDAGDSCTHHSFYEYITFYVHPNTDLSPSQNQRGQHIPALVPSKKLELSAMAPRVRQICAAKIAADL